MKRAPPEFWSTKQIQEVRALRAEGLTRFEIADRMGRSPEAVKGLLHRQKIYQSRGGYKIDGWTEQETQTLVDLWSAGRTYREISELLGTRSLQACVQKRLHLKLPSRGRKEMKR